MIDRLRESCSLTGQQANTVVDTLFDIIIGRLVEGDSILLKGLGTFRVTVRKPCYSRNPKNGEQMWIPKRAQVHFRPARELRTRIQERIPEDER